LAYVLADTTDAALLETRDPESFKAGWLEILDAPCVSERGRRVALNRELTAFGRDVAEAAYTFADARMSRLHARCVWDACLSALRVGDAQSKNGTYVNGKRVESALLSHGDVLRMGDTLFLYADRESDLVAAAEISQVARSPLCVLVLGESGTGKEVLARQIHQASGRKGSFVAVNCGSLPRELVASELFGHARGAFSGAEGMRRGLFMAADGGTLMLDEIGDCPHEAQVALLRALQEKMIRPVGTERELSVDVRIVAATHQDLAEAVRRGNFRADLYARLAQVTLQVPTLRERRAEILPLARHFAREVQRNLSVSVDAAEALCLYDWPLNVRELKSCLDAFSVRVAGDALLDVAYLLTHHPQMATLIEARKRASSTPGGEGWRAASEVRDRRSHLRNLLHAYEGNVSKVAEAVGKPRAQVYRWMRAMGLSAEQFRK
jgi:DNA-binding NtrC family response regulator